MKILDNFNGYLTIDNDVFVYSVSDFIVTLLPAQSQPLERATICKQIRVRNKDSSEYLFGEHNGYTIAILRNNKFCLSNGVIDYSIRFSTPLIIKAAGNANGFYSMLTEKWNKFHAITFEGGNINALHIPEMAINDIESCLNNNGAREIKIHSWDKYTRSIDFNIGKENVTLTVSISPSNKRNDQKQIGAYSLGELNSFISLSFENAQDFVQIEKYYKIIKSLIAILTRQNNIFCEVYLSQRNKKNLYFKTASCKICDGYINYSLKKYHDVIALDDIIDYIPNLIDKIINNELNALLTLLPEDNRRINQISVINIQDLCTALEVAYNWNREDRKIDNQINELKRELKAVIRRFNKTHPEIDVSKKTTISSAFTYLDCTLKQKIFTLYNENQNVLDEIISKKSLSPIKENNISSFVKLRNGKAHSGTFEWGDSVEVYMTLLVLVYICLLKYIKIPDKDIERLIFKIF